MTVPRNVTLCVRPCLAAAGRWSVDYWLDGRQGAAYQAGLVTYASIDEARKDALQFQANFAAKGDTVQLTEAQTNASLASIPKPTDSEEEIKKRLESYVEKYYEPAQSAITESLFDLKKVAKFIGDSATQSPLLLSGVVLITLIFRSRLELLASAIPGELGLKATSLLPAAPLLILVTTMLVYSRRRENSKRLGRIRLWVLQLAVHFGWERESFSGILKNEIARLEFASLADRLEAYERNNPISFTNLSERVRHRFEANAWGDSEVFTRGLVRDDFARKIQALAGLGGETGYRAKDLGILPFHLIVSRSSLTVLILGLLGATPDGTSGPAGIYASRGTHEKIALRSAIFSLLLIVGIIGLPLAWSTVLSLRVSHLLFACNVAASLLTLWLLLRRPLMLVFRHQYIPRGLELHECLGALLI